MVTCRDRGEEVTCRDRGEEVTCLDRGEKVTFRDRRTLILVAIICLLLLLLSYHRHLRVISEALELCVEGERVNHSWCMGVVGHGYGGLGGDRDEGGGWYSCGTRPGWLAGRWWSISRMRGDTLKTPVHTAIQVRSYG